VSSAPLWFNQEYPMDIQFVAGFGPIVPDLEASRAFYGDHLGIALSEGDYPATDDLEGVKAFALWSLSSAAESCFGSTAWPAEIPRPQAWLEFELHAAAAVAPAAAELEAKGHHLLVQAKTEPWGQTVARLLSPEGLLVGVVYTPWFHKKEDPVG
jgi:catechol 2,3-dioxygenase-like lactoylglutathione lyase family enzyme